MPQNIQGLLASIDTDFVNYRKPAMVLEFPYCDFKCDKECGKQVCQNSRLATTPDIKISQDDVIQRYLNNPITEAIVCQGLEPFDSLKDLTEFIARFRKCCDDDIVIYTGYKEEEISNLITMFLEGLPNIIVKFGRYIPNQQAHYDDVLGVSLASDNQYAKKIG